MALTFTFCGSVSSTTAAASYTVDTNTATPAANSLLVACVINSLGSSPIDPTGVTGHGETYTKLTLTANALSTTHVMSVWVAKATSPTSTAVTASFNAVNQTGCIIHEFGITGADIVGTAAAAIVQNPTSTGTATSATATNLLAAAGQTGNLAIAFWARLYNEAAASVGGNWAEVANADTNYNTPRTALESQVTATTFDRSPGASWTNNVVYRVVALEIKAVIDTARAPAQGTVEVTGQAPSLLTQFFRQPDAGSAEVTGLAPTVEVSTQGSTVAPSAGAVVVDGFAPSLLIDTIVQPGAGSVAADGQIPSLLTNYIYTPGAGEIIYGGFTPTVTESGSARVGRVTWIRFTAPPAAIGNTVVTPGCGVIEVTGQAPTSIGGEASVAEQPAVGGVGKPRRDRPSVRRWREPVWVEVRNGKVYRVEDAQEAKKVVTTIRKQAERKVRQAVRAEVPLTEFPPLPVIDVGGEYRDWMAALAQEVQLTNDHLAALYAKAQEELAIRLDDEETIEALMWDAIPVRPIAIEGIAALGRDDEDALTALLLT